MKRTAATEADRMVMPFFSRGRWWLLACMLAGAMLFAGLALARGYERAWRAWGIEAGSTPFIDLQVVTAGAESRALGYDPLHDNPRDPMRRQMNYPRVWQSLTYAGVTLRHTTPLGIAIVMAFLAAVVGFAWRLERGPGLALAVALFSPAIMLCLERGNIDLVMFAVATVALLLARRSAVATTGVLLVGFALKLYPVLGLVLLLRESRRRFLVLIGSAAVVVAVYAICQREEIRAIRAATPSDTWLSYGLVPASRVLSIALDGTSRWLVVSSQVSAVLALLALAVVAFWKLGWNGSGAEGGDIDETSLDAFRLGAGVYAGSFLLGSNFDYRMVFLLFAVPQLWNWSRGHSRDRRWAAVLTLATGALALWQMLWKPLAEPVVGKAVASLIEQAVKTATFGGCAYLSVVSAPVWLGDWCLQLWGAMRAAWLGVLRRPTLIVFVLLIAVGLGFQVELIRRSLCDEGNRIMLPGTRDNALLAQAIWSRDVSGAAEMSERIPWPQPLARLAGLVAREGKVPAVTVIRVFHLANLLLLLVGGWSVVGTLIAGVMPRLLVLATIMWGLLLVQSLPLAQWILPVLACAALAGWLALRAQPLRGAARALVLSGVFALMAVAAVEGVAGCLSGPARGPRADCRGLSAAIGEFVPRDSTCLIIGDDKQRLLALAAERKSCVWTRWDDEHFEEALCRLEQERIGAVILGNGEPVDRVRFAALCRRLNCDVEPTFVHETGTVHLSYFVRESAVARLAEPPAFAGVSSIARAENGVLAALPRMVPPGEAASAFPMIRPQPVLYNLAFGYALWPQDRRMVLRANSDSIAWVPVPLAAKRIHWEFGLLDDSYRNEHGTNGVEFMVEAELPDGTRRCVFRRVLDPASNERDRGVQVEEIAFSPQVGERLVFRSTGNGDNSFDWSYWRRIDVE